MLLELPLSVAISKSSTIPSNLMASLTDCEKKNKIFAAEVFVLSLSA